MFSRILGVHPCHAGRVGVQIHAFNHAAMVCAVMHEVAEVLERHIALLAHLESFITAAVELLDRALKVYPQILCGNPQYLAHRARDPRAVGVHVVDSSELRRDLVVETVGEGVGNLAENVEARCNG